MPNKIKDWEFEFRHNAENMMKSLLKDAKEHDKYYEAIAYIKKVEGQIGYGDVQDSLDSATKMIARDICECALLAIYREEGNMDIKKGDEGDE